VATATPTITPTVTPTNTPQPAEQAPAASSTGLLVALVLLAIVGFVALSVRSSPSR
jgi:hypothetical protein